MSDITNQDLKELILSLDKKNELRFAEMDKISELRFAEMDKKMEVGFTELKGEIKRVETELKGEIKRVETELKGEIKQVETELKGEIKCVEVEIKRVDDKLNGIDKRLLGEETVSRSVFVALIVTILTAGVKYFFFPSPPIS